MSPTTISLSAFREAAEAYIERITAGESFFITSHGETIARLDAFDILGAERTKALLISVDGFINRYRGTLEKLARE